jgi:hypothetical protein
MLQLPDEVCQALRQLAQRSDFLLFGELHGTQETPQLLTAMSDDLTALGYGGLALEIPRGDQEAILRWATGASGVVPHFFTQPPSDGRGNEQSLALIRQVGGKGWQVLCFDHDSDQPCATWAERDRVMADNLAAEWTACCPDRKVVGVSGNLHSRLVLTQGFEHLWPSFAACFQQANPQHVIHTVDIVPHGGSFFNHLVRSIESDPLAAPELREDPRLGHSFALHLPRVTPATFLGSPAE